MLRRNPIRHVQERGVLTFVENTVDATTGMIKLKERSRIRHAGVAWGVRAVMLRPDDANQRARGAEPGGADRSGRAFRVRRKPDAPVESRPVVTGATMIKTW